MIKTMPTSIVFINYYFKVNPPSTLRSLLSNLVENSSSTIIYKICKTFKITLKDFYNSELFDFDNIDD